MNIDEMSYFQTIDLEKSLTEIDRHRKAMISELDDVCGMLSESGWHGHLDDLATRLEEIDEVLELIWSEMKQQQDDLEIQNPSAVLALTA